MTEGKWTRLANATSFLVRHSSARGAEEITRTGREPKRRKMMGPWRVERRARARWRGFSKRWRWPMKGREGGLGGSFLLEEEEEKKSFVKMMKENRRKRRRREREGRWRQEGEEERRRRISS